MSDSLLTSYGVFSLSSRFPTANRKSQSVFSLVEVTLALGIAGVCLLAILGLLQTALMSERVTMGQTAASGIISAVFSDIVSTPSTNASSTHFGVSLNASNTQTIYFSEAGWTNRVGQSAVTDSRYRVSVSIQPANVGPTPVRILVTWPAGADFINASGSVEVVTALDRN